MSKKKSGLNRPHGHYCKICGEYKANEKFSTCAVGNYAATEEDAVNGAE